MIVYGKITRNNWLDWYYLFIYNNISIYNFMIYAGIGSRETPDRFLKLFIHTGKCSANMGFTLRSGGADGADTAFEQGYDLADDIEKGKKEIYLPWKGYNDNPSEHYFVSKEAIELAKKYHPAWSHCSQGARKLHGRNAYIILGEHLDNPVDFVICWTPETGGTQQALRMAKDYNIPIFNFFDERETISYLKFIREKRKCNN